MSNFRTEKGLTFQGVTWETLATMRRELFDSYGLVPLQLCEAAAYSHAMVIRFALGLYATAGEICVLARDNLCGYSALAAARHLVNAGARAKLVLLPGKRSETLERQLRPLRHSGLVPLTWGDDLDPEGFERILLNSHNVVCGIYDGARPADPELDQLVDIMNEVETPVHALEAPLGLHPDLGTAVSTPLYASSTLSLGCSLQGLWVGRDYVGRHYLCDTSFSPRLYTAHAADLSQLFSEQPVVRIFPQVDEQPGEEAP